MMNHRNTCAALAAALAAFACSLASAQWAPFSALPGADRVDRGQVGGSAGRVSEVRWDLPGGKAWSRQEASHSGQEIHRVTHACDIALL